MCKFSKNALFFSSIILIISIVIGTAEIARADVGNNNRYETEEKDNSNIIYESGDSSITPGTIILLIAFFGGYYILKKKGVFDKTDNTKQVIEQIQKIDPAFSSDAFIGWSREVFIKIQQAWTERNWTIIRPFESNELFSQHSAQLQEYIRNNKINVIEKIAVQSCKLNEFRTDGDKEVLIVELQAVMRDYIIDANTRKVLESDPNKDWTMNYLMTFNRKAGVKTKVGTSNKSTTNCPNCGAPTQITSSGQCRYCDSVITTGEHDWVLSDIRSIK